MDCRRQIGKDWFSKCETRIPKSAFEVRMVPFIDLTRQYQGIQEEILSATRRVLEKGKFILGEEVSAFEGEFAQYCGVRYGVGVNSGTDALYLALKAVGVGNDDEVITVANSFIASALAISFTGAKPIFVDIDPETYNMDPNQLEHLLRKRRSKRIKAILPVHLYGQPAEMDSILEVASRYGLAVIEDACQAHGAEYKGKKAGSLGAMGCFSFYPTKNLGGYGDGGMVVTDHKKLYERLRLLRCYGEKKRYKHILQGGNSRLDELQAAVLRVKLKYLDRWNDQRRGKARLYRRNLEGTGVICPVEKEGNNPIYHLFVVRTRKRNALQKFLKEKEIDTLIHYPIPIHLQKVYKELGYQKGDLPITERCSLEILSLPFFPELSESEIMQVGECIKYFFQAR